MIACQRPPKLMLAAAFKNFWSRFSASMSFLAAARSALSFRCLSDSPAICLLAAFAATRALLASPKAVLTSPCALVATEFAASAALRAFVASLLASAALVNATPTMAFAASASVFAVRALEAASLSLPCKSSIVRASAAIWYPSNPNKQKPATASITTPKMTSRWPTLSLGVSGFPLSKTMPTPTATPAASSTITSIELTQNEVGILLTLYLLALVAWIFAAVCATWALVRSVMAWRRR
jgi:hypothetical protein